MKSLIALLLGVALLASTSIASAQCNVQRSSASSSSSAVDLQNQALLNQLQILQSAQLNRAASSSATAVAAPRFQPQVLQLVAAPRASGASAVAVAGGGAVPAPNPVLDANQLSALSSLLSSNQVQLSGGGCGGSCSSSRSSALSRVRNISPLQRNQSVSRSRAVTVTRN